MDGRCSWSDERGAITEIFAGQPQPWTCRRFLSYPVEIPGRTQAPLRVMRGREFLMKDGYSFNWPGSGPGSL